jgi:hypothetical protein
MSSENYFIVLPFDPFLNTDPNPQIELPIDREDLIKQLQEQCPTGEIRDMSLEGHGTHIMLYISHDTYGPWVICNILFNHGTVLEIGTWPRSLTKQLVIWYRHYVSLEYLLFMVEPDSERMIELTQHTTEQDIEEFYTYPPSPEFDTYNCQPSN